MITAAGSGLLPLVGRASLEVVVTASVVMAVGVNLVGTLILDMILAAPPERAGAATGWREGRAPDPPPSRSRHL